MAKITCEIIKDLTPLYVDGVLSEDSRVLVEEHIDKCPECREYLQSMQDSTLTGIIDKAGEAAQSEAKEVRNTFEKIKKRIYAFRTTAIVMAAALVLVCGFVYGFFIHQSYVSYAESGLHEDGERLVTNKTYGTFYEIYSPDYSVEFIYEKSSYNQRRESRNAGVRPNVEVLSLSGDSLITYEATDEGNKEHLITQIYYVPEEYARQLEKGYWLTPDLDEEKGYTEEEWQKEYEKINKEKVEELKAASEPLWTVYIARD